MFRYVRNMEGSVVVKGVILYIRGEIKHYVKAALQERKHKRQNKYFPYFMTWILCNKLN
jgi:hypothetical protein